MEFFHITSTAEPTAAQTVRAALYPTNISWEARLQKLLIRRIAHQSTLGLTLVYALHATGRIVQLPSRTSRSRPGATSAPSPTVIFFDRTARRTLADVLVVSHRVLRCLVEVVGLVAVLQPVPDEVWVEAFIFLHCSVALSLETLLFHHLSLSRMVHVHRQPSARSVHPIDSRHVVDVCQVIGRTAAPSTSSPVSAVTVVLELEDAVPVRAVVVLLEDLGVSPSTSGDVTPSQAVLARVRRHDYVSAAAAHRLHATPRAVRRVSPRVVTHEFVNRLSVSDLLLPP